MSCAGHGGAVFLSEQENIQVFGGVIDEPSQLKEKD